MLEAAFLLYCAMWLGVWFYWHKMIGPWNRATLSKHESTDREAVGEGGTRTAS